MTFSMRTAKWAVGIAFVASTLASSALAEDGVTDTKITFGQVAALDGPASALGTGMRTGILAAFGEANAKGGVHGRSLDLLSRDDGYEPDRSINETKAAIDQDHVFALIGPVGTPTSAATQPIATEAKVPYIGPFTGAGFLRNAELGNVVNVRASYGAETETWIKYLVDQQGMKKIAILYQDDAFGRVGLDGVTKALEARNMTLAAQGTYQRNTTAVKSALLEIRKAEPEAVVMVGAYKPIAEFIKLSRKIKFDPTFVNISFVGSNALAAELGEDGEGVIISQVVPFPWDDSIPVIKDYQAALKAMDGSLQPDFVSLEGYIVGRLAIAALDKAGADVTRQGFLDAALNGSFDFGGAVLSFGAGDNQGMDDVFMTEIKAGKTFAPISAPSG